MHAPPGMLQLYSIQIRLMVQYGTSGATKPVFIYRVLAFVKGQCARLAKISSVLDRTKRAHPVCHPTPISSAPPPCHLTIGKVKQRLLDAPKCVKRMGHNTPRVIPRLWLRLTSSLQGLPCYRDWEAIAGIAG